MSHSIVAVAGDDLPDPGRALPRAPLGTVHSGWWRPAVPIGAEILAGALGTAALLALGDRSSLALAAALPALWLVLLVATGALRLDAAPGTRRVQARLALRAGALLGLGLWALDAVVPLPVSSASLVVATATVTAASTLMRLGRTTMPARVLVVGECAQVLETLPELRRRASGLEPVGVCTLAGTGLPADLADLDLGRDLAAVPEAVSHSGADAVLVLPGPTVSARDVQRLGWQLAPDGVHLYVGTGLLDVAAARATFAEANGLQMVHLRPLPPRGPARCVKALLETLLAGVLLMLLLPVMGLVAIAVRLDSPGPAWFAQRRVGRDGRVFTMYKFRTMEEAAEDRLATLAARDEGAGVLFKMRADPRVTRVGAVLRRYSLDELPQLVNVLRGDMALVGPRPALPSEVARYDIDPRRRLAVKPGLTGLWQVSGRSDLTWPETVRLDLRYVDNWSLRLDAWILYRTVGAVLSRRGAY